MGYSKNKRKSGDHYVVKFLIQNNNRYSKRRYCGCRNRSKINVFIRYCQCSTDEGPVVVTLCRVKFYKNFTSLFPYM